MNNEEKFSDDPEEQLRIENELLKLKLQAELGARFGNNRELSPEMEQEFLKQVMAFHEQQQQAAAIKVKDYLGFGPQRPLSAIPGDQVTAAWQELEALLAGKHLQILFTAEVTAAVRYDFVVSELFELDIMQPAEDTNLVFDYEDFHPDHKKDMASRTEEFMKGFFENNIHPDAWYLAKSMVTPLGRAMDITELIGKVRLFHELFTAIEAYTYTILETRIDEQQKETTNAMSEVAGTVNYTILTSDGQPQEVTGPFKLYFHCVDGWWEIFSFQLHGFTADQ